MLLLVELLPGTAVLLLCVLLESAEQGVRQQMYAERCCMVWVAIMTGYRNCRQQMYAERWCMHDMLIIHARLHLAQRCLA